ncbi:MAG: TRAP transporter small permease [Desulfobacterales bacterium]|jgi:TRAP-type C4-dicarboxylate transport system permease small subunit|nr:TRAP transporter small permease [Desulfobacterales bacterium]MDD3080660.1 TRAP transporter small permease [Desulfobacterales bacterium]MDD3949667.1 TRAP transporter small permease [Desulfobacterales bacterium]MDY0377577.1 TRAP transporter small permease [Desulfobacterales bacterium]
MDQAYQKTRSFAVGFNWIASAAVIVMMLLTTADVIMRLAATPIPGVYEIVGLLGVVAVSFSLAYTSVEKGHIAVEFLVRKLPRKAQAVVAAANDFLSLVLFFFICRQCVVYAGVLKQSGEVSLTIQMPIYPFVYGIAIGCAALCIVLLMEFIQSIRRIVQ